MYLGSVDPIPVAAQLNIFKIIDFLSPVGAAGQLDGAMALLFFDNICHLSDEFVGIEQL